MQKMRIKITLQFTAQPFLCSDDRLESSIPPQRGHTPAFLFQKCRRLCFDPKSWRGRKKFVNILVPCNYFVEFAEAEAVWFSDEPPQLHCSLGLVPTDVASVSPRRHCYSNITRPPLEPRTKIAS